MFFLNFGGLAKTHFEELAESLKKNYFEEQKCNLKSLLRETEWKFLSVIKECHLLFTSVEDRVVEDRVTYCMIEAESRSLVIHYICARLVFYVWE